MTYAYQQNNDGFVIQTFDTTKQAYISQEFMAGDVEYENQDGSSASLGDMAKEGFGPFAESGEPYLPFEMVQPNKGINK